MESILIIIKDTIALLKSKSSVLSKILVLLLVAAVVVMSNYEKIDNFLFKKDITKDYVSIGNKVEENLKVTMVEYDCSSIYLATIHNGTTSIANPNFHLMKFTISFGIGSNARGAKIQYQSIPLSIWIDNFRLIIKNGYYSILDSRTHTDPLIRRNYKETGMVTQIYLPLYSKQGFLNGFYIVSWNKKRIISNKLVKQIQRSLESVDTIF
jgi:hypothetical protein